jgi:phosphoribosylanthranilate isomerase
MFVKVCGLKTREQIDAAIEYGYDAVGIVSCEKSKRHCPAEEARRLAEYARGRIKTFVVGLTYSDVKAIASEFDYTQIYEARQVPNLVLASKERPPAGLRYEYFIFDASIGSGVFQEFPEWVKNVSDRLLLAGGLNKENVRGVIQHTRPFGIDVSSGVERDGVKDLTMMKEFMDTVTACQC